MELNSQYIGSFIKFMRQRAGLTQSELAGRIGVGSKAISKWEQGRGIPDISLLYSLSLELDVDIESLLAGNLDDIGKEWDGVICADAAEGPELGEREWECMISMFLLVGIRDIAVLCINGDRSRPEELLRRYQEKGILRKTFCTDSLEGLIRRVETGKKHTCLLYQPAFLYGMNLTRYMRRAMFGGKTKVLALRQGRDSFMPEVCFDNSFACFRPNGDTDSEWHMFPMLFCKDDRITGYLEQMHRQTHIDFSQSALSEYFEPMHVEAMERGMLAFSFMTERDRALAGQVLLGIEESQNIKIGDLEEIMRVRGWARC